jgi:hypothetical protein
VKNIKIIFFLFYILSIFKFNLNAQNLKEFTRDIIKEEIRIFSFPFRAQKDDLHLTAEIIGAGIVIYSYDDKIRNSILKSRTDPKTDFLIGIEEIQSDIYDISFITGYGLVGSILKDDYMKETALMAGESLISATFISTLIKYSFGRARPYTGDGKSKFTPFTFKTSRTSFPSGHTIRLFSIATVFAERSNSILIKILFYATASATAFERIYSDKHWSSDVFFGATLGYLIGKDIVKGNNKSDTILVYLFNKGIMLAFRI